MIRLGDLNLYAYANNDPINLSDPTGLVPDCNGCTVIPALQPLFFRQPLITDLFGGGGGFRFERPSFGGGGGGPIAFPNPGPAQGEEDAEKDPCQGAPAAPGTDKTSEELMDMARANAEIAESQKWNPFGFLWFYHQVRNRGPWDYKQINAGFQDFGNYNYGYTGTALGFSSDFLLRQAGRAQIRAGTSRPDWGTPSTLGFFGGIPPYGDDPRDQEMIKRGIADRKNRC